MSKWEKYKIQESSSPENRWDKYRVQKPQEALQTPSVTPQQSNLEIGAKSVASGLLSNFDIPQTVATFALNPEYGLYGQGRKFFNYFKGKPHTPLSGPLQSLPENMASNKVKGAIKQYSDVDLTPKPMTGSQNILSHAGEFAGGLGPFGLLNKGKGALNAIKAIGKSTAMGGAIGGVSGGLQEAGVDPLVADIGSSLVTPGAINAVRPKNLLNMAKQTSEAPANITRRLMGLDPQNLNIKAAQAARDLDIDLPAAALTEAKSTALADQYVGKTPFFGDQLAKKYTTAEQQTKDALGKIYEEIGPKKTPEIESKIAKLYDVRAKSLPKGAVVTPNHLENAIDNIKINTAILSPDEKSLLQSLETIKKEIKPESNLLTPFGKIKMPLQEISVDKLVGTKKSLNQLIKWDTDEGIKNQLRSIQKAVAKDIEVYGKTNPKWYKSFKEADDLFSKVAKREKLETQISGSINPSTNDLSYASLSKRIHEPRQLAKIKKQVTPEVFNKIEKLGTVARAMAIKNRSIPNPSGTATTTAVLGAITGSIYAPISTLGATVATKAATELLTNKKFLDAALKYAENPNLVTAIPVKKSIKDITGYSATTLTREINRTREEE